VSALGLVAAAAVRTADDAVAEAARTRPRLCLVHLHLPGSGIAAVRRIVAASPKTKIAVTGPAGRGAEVIDALRAGAAAYLIDSRPTEQLVRGLALVLGGEVVVPRSATAALVDALRASERPDRGAASRRPAAAARLTEREWQVLELLRAGFSTTQIARRLVVSAVTVRSHIRAVVRKLGVVDRAAAVELIEAAR
jgi:DNA-binding NarL/FixJ family response regulator